MPFTSSDERSVERMIAHGGPFSDDIDARIAATWFMSPDSPAINRYAQGYDLRAADFIAQLGTPEFWADEVTPGDLHPGQDIADTPSSRTIVRALILWAETVRDMGEDERCDGEGAGIGWEGYYGCPGCSACDSEEG